MCRSKKYTLHLHISMVLVELYSFSSSISRPLFIFWWFYSALMPEAIASNWSQKEVVFDWLVVLVSLHSLSEVLHIATVRVDHNKLLCSHVAQVRAVTKSLYLHDSLHTILVANQIEIFLVLADYKAHLWLTSKKEKMHCTKTIL